MKIAIWIYGMSTSVEGAYILKEESTLPSLKEGILERIVGIKDSHISAGEIAIFFPKDRCQVHNSDGIVVLIKQLHVDPSMTKAIKSQIASEICTAVRAFLLGPSVDCVFEAINSEQVSVRIGSCS